MIEITADILKRKDDQGQDGPIVNYIMDAAGNKGTGKWTSQSSLDLGVPLSLITESVFARYISTYKDERVAASKVLPKPAPFAYEGDKAELVEKSVKHCTSQNHVLCTRFCTVARSIKRKQLELAIW